jgi:5,10-methylenetetrahydromethanopterin reductase
LGEPKASEIVEIARKSEALGFDSLWMCETRFTRDAVSPLAAMAMVTTRARLGSAAINVFTRGPVLIGASFATLDELSGGRMILGLGAGSPAILDKQGIEFTGALKRLKEYVDIFRFLIKGGPVTYKGEYTSVKGVELEFTPVRKEIPVYLAVTGPKALHLAGQIADGVILNGFTSVDYAKRAIRRVEEGARSVGRKLTDLDITSSNIISVSEDSKAAKEALRWLVATYLVTFPAIAGESGVPSELLQSIQSVYNTNGLNSAMTLVPDSVIESLTVSGNPDECVNRLRKYLDAGVGKPIVMPVGSDPELVLKVSLKA